MTGDSSRSFRLMVIVAVSESPGVPSSLISTVSVKAAVDHINHYGSHHSDAIMADSDKAQKLFVREVDSATVYVNASTRFTDGGEFGMGAEIGISTDKLHARGPMGLEELTTYKYVVRGNGQIRE